VRRLALKSWAALFFIWLLTISSSAQKEHSPQPRISFSETVWDFGYVPKTGTVSHTFLIKNTGEDTLVIVKVRTSCGCTAAPLSKQRLAPDETAELKLIFDPRKIVVGETTKRIRIISNDPVNPFADVQFIATIGKKSSLVKLTPTEINFDTVAQGTEDLRTITIENISGEKLSMEVVDGPGEDVELTGLSTRTLKPGESIEINVRLRRDASLGTLHSSLTLDFEGSREARISIPIGGVVVSR